MTQKEAQVKAATMNLSVDCVREKLGRNKRRVTYRLLREQREGAMFKAVPVATSPIGWKHLFAVHEEVKS